jgi:3-oxoadipate enol-lactonase
MIYYKGSTADCSLNVIRAGRREKPLVVLAHAVGMDLTYWSDQIGALEADYDVVAYDLRGHGSSTVCAAYDFPALAGDLACVVTQADNGAAHIVGLSVGGMIAQTLALSRPDLVRSLTLIDTTSTFSDQVRTVLRARADTVRFSGMGAIVQPTLERWFTADFAARRPDVINRVAKTLLSTDAHVHAAMWDTIATLDVADAINGLSIPTLVLVGENDPTTPPAAARVIAERIRQAKLMIIPGASHISPVEAPQFVNGKLLEFFGTGPVG